jgi:hypothetical protein
MKFRIKSGYFIYRKLSKKDAKQLIEFLNVINGRTSSG